MLPELLPTDAQPVTDDTWLIPTIAASPTGEIVAVHSLVIRGAEPVIVDTGVLLARDSWIEQAFSVVEPSDVRWIFLSHDDHDHVGNLEVVLDQCPQATLVCNFPIVLRLMGDMDLPAERMRWLDPGDALDIGDRVLTVVRPPMFDSPATRAVHDSATNMLWAVDSFGSLLPGVVYEATDVPAEMFDGSFAALNSWNTPWLEWVDPDRFAAHVRTTASLPIDVVASAHGPLLRGDRIADAFARTLDLAGQPPVPMPGQEMLDQLLATMLASPTGT